MTRDNADLIWFLGERAKELECLYSVEALLSRQDMEIGELGKGLAEAIPPGWQHPQVCVARVTIDDQTFESPGFRETEWKHSVDIKVRDSVVGDVTVCYTEEMPDCDDGPFLKQEARLLGSIADRIGRSLTLRTMTRVSREIDDARKGLSESNVEEWRVVLNLLKRTDKHLFLTVTHKMLNQLCWKGIAEAEILLEQSVRGRSRSDDGPPDDENRPLAKDSVDITEPLSEQIFEIARTHLTDDQIITNIQKWIQEDKLSFLVDVASPNLSLSQVRDAIRRYRHIVHEGIGLPDASRRGVQVSLIRRLLSDQLELVNIAKKIVDIDDFDNILDHIVSASASYGRLGGKAAGLFLAWHAIQKATDRDDDLPSIRMPETWHISSDVVSSFLRFNSLNEVMEQKYKDIDQVRFEYPRIVQTFKNCPFPPEIVQGLAMVLDAVGDTPLIVRSSSLLEDRMGAAFAGKYKSLFLANQGPKEHRLEALTDAIAEVYASTFGPDPIEYRTERGLVDYKEEMGILIQEVVGTRVGDYFLPAFAGVALSRNDFRWSSRIKREDGLVRIVPGLGTRAVDRMADDYPVVTAPGQPGLRVNATIDEVVRYSPKHVDVINLRTNTFETIAFSDLLREHGNDVPGITKIVSLIDDQRLRKAIGRDIDFESEVPVVTFDGVFDDTPFVKQIHNMLRILEETFDTAVDIEFAHDGKDLYLLQCRAQSGTDLAVPAHIPSDVTEERAVFTANKYVSNGSIRNITHIVYVDPLEYGRLADKSDLIAVGKAIGKLNMLLPKRQFVLMGPGRWGSRGDIKLGVNVTYSDINNTALLVEIARKKGSYVPELSFGTHFFLDLVEADIRYLPLYPDDGSTLFNETFLKGSPNIFSEILPDYAALADTIRLIDVPGSTNGLLFHVLMNGDRDEAVGVLAEIDSYVSESAHAPEPAPPHREDFWSWRLQMAESIAAQVDPDRFGIHEIYVFGSTKNATARPFSDIDLLVHFRGTAEQREALLLWSEGWSKCLDEMNYLKTGSRTGGLLDLHIVTDEDVANKTSFAVKIGAVTDAARPLPMGAWKR